VKEFHGHDDWFEDDNGHECHSIDGDWIINFVECEDLESAKKKVDEIAEANADNPPYDRYDFVFAYEKDSKKIVPRGYLYTRSEEEWV
jgi:hypothetical protein